jgi:hypothetical protein
MQTEGRWKSGKKTEMSTSFPLLLSDADSSSDKKTRIRLLTLPHGMMRYNGAAGKSELLLSYFGGQELLRIAAFIGGRDCKTW